MIRKIKKYKISVRPFYVQRMLKKKWSGPEAESDLEKLAEEAAARLLPLAVPQAVYETFSRRDTPAALESLWAVASAQALSVSLILSTIGIGLEREVERCRDEGRPLEGILAESVARDALEQSSNFVLKLLGDEAKAESCEISPALPVEQALLPSVLEALESHKVGISLSGTNQVTPLFTSALISFWNPPPKGKSSKPR